MRCVLLARRICFLLVKHDTKTKKYGYQLENALAKVCSFMPAYSLTNIYDIQYGLLKFRNLLLDDEYPSVKMFHFNNLLAKDKLDGETDPYLIKVMGSKTKG